MDIVLNARPHRLRSLGWGALLPLVMLVCTVYWGIRPWTVLVIAVAAAVAWLAPSVAGELAAIALIGFASLAFALIERTSTLPPGSPTAGQYPLHALVFGNGGLPHKVDLAAGLVMLAFGVWLVPRTIGGRAALARRNRELIGRVRRLAVARGEAVDSAAAELRRVERDLHDGAQARLIALGISLRAIERLIRTDPDAAVELAAESRDNSARALAELRALVSGINPPVLAERGLGDALRALALDSPLPSTTDIDLPRRLPAPVQAAAYFAVAEALANAAKHAAAHSVHIRAPIWIADQRDAPERPECQFRPCLPGMMDASIGPVRGCTNNSRGTIEATERAIGGAAAPQAARGPDGGGGTAVSIGEVLANARDQAGLSIAQVSEQTRIRQGIIQGIEADDYGVCGGDFYVRGHIRSIAHAVGTDPDPLIEEYDQDFSDTGPISATGIEELVARSRPPERPRLNPAVLIAAAVVVLLGVGGYLLATGLGHGRGPGPAAAPNSLAGHSSGSASPAAAQASQAVVVRLTSPHGTSVVFTTMTGKYLSRSYAAAGTAVTYKLHRAVHIKLSNPAGVRLTVDGKNPLPARPAAGPVTLSLGPGRPVTVATAPVTASPAPSSPPTSSVQNLQPVNATAFGAFGRPGDNPQEAPLAVDHTLRTAWHSDWYSTPRFGNLYPGTGLLLDMGHRVTVVRVRVRLGFMPGAHFQIRVGSARDLAGLPVAARSAGPGGVIRLKLSSPAHGRYVLVWFTQLPRDAAGTFQVSVFNVVVRGQG